MNPGHARAARAAGPGSSAQGCMRGGVEGQAEARLVVCSAA